MAKTAVGLLLGLSCMATYGSANTTAAAPATEAPTSAGTTPTPDGTTAKLVHATCVDYACPPGWYPRKDLEKLDCMGAKCAERDLGTCCIEGEKSTTAKPKPVVTTVTPKPPVNVTTTKTPITAPPTTPPPTPSPPYIPSDCDVIVPKGGNQPWFVYKEMKVSTPRIETAQKLLMGGQTLNLTGVLDIRAARFECEMVDHEMRAVLKAGATAASPVAMISVHNSLYPDMVTTQCLLTQISLFKSASGGIPGLRFDYDDCPFGPAKKATLLIGLRMVPDDWGDTPGLANFFKDTCKPGGKQTKGGDSLLNLDLLSMKAGGTCFAESADYSLLTSDCFESAMVFTLTDANNHFALFPVTTTEWKWMQDNVPAAPANQCETAAPVAKATPETPCATPAPPIKCNPLVYGSMVQNRLCVAMPELGCHNFCGKVCLPIIPFNDTATTIPPDCITCYDCEFPEMMYAFWCTIAAFIICQSYHKCWSGGWGCCRWGGVINEKYWTQEIQMPELPYSQLTQPKRAVSRETCCQASVGFFFLSFFSTLAAFVIVNFCDFLLSSKIHGQEMCVKLFDWQNIQAGGGFWEGTRWESTAPSLFSCQNDVCIMRLLGLFVTVWMSLFALFCYWRYWLQVTVEKEQIKRVEARVEFGAGTGPGVFAYGGSAPIACTVQ